MSRTRILTVALVACLALVLVYLVIDLNRQNQKQSAWKEQIGASTSTLGMLHTPSVGIETRLAAAQATYQTALNGVSLKIAPTGVIKALLELTDSYKFKVNPITTEPRTRRSIGTAMYEILPINLSLDGHLTDVRLFLKSLEDETKFPSLEIENTRIEPLSRQSVDSSLYDTTLQIRISIIERILTNE
jgi:hypothetical protein